MESHLQQHIGVTPIVKDPDLRHNLSELRLDAISNRFSCFFFHELDLTNGHLPGVQKVDPPAMLDRMGVKPHKPKPPLPDLPM